MEIEKGARDRKNCARLTSEHGGGLEGALEVAGGGLAEDVERDGLGVVEVLDAHERLDEEGLGEVEVDVHDAHHREAHVYRA